MVTPSELELLVAECRRNLQLGESLGDEYRYAHLALCVVDAIYSIGVRYESTQAVVARYAVWANISRNRPADELPARERQQPLTALVEHITAAGPDAFAADIVRNRQRTSTRNGVLKSAAVLRYAVVLIEHGVEYLQDVAPVASDKRLDAALRAVTGQKSGISTAYFFMLAGDDSLVKPDRMLQRFVARALGRSVELAPIQDSGARRLGLRPVAQRASALDSPGSRPRDLELRARTVAAGLALTLARRLAVTSLSAGPRAPRLRHTEARGHGDRRAANRPIASRTRRRSMFSRSHCSGSHVEEVATWKRCVTPQSVPAPHAVRAMPCAEGLRAV